MIRRCICLMLQPWRMNSVDSQSSNSGFDGGSPIFPKLPGVGTIAVPKCHPQMRLTMTREVNGLSGEAIHSPNARRRPLVGYSGRLGISDVGGGVPLTNTVRKPGW